MIDADAAILDLSKDRTRENTRVLAPSSWIMLCNLRLNIFALLVSSSSNMAIDVCTPSNAGFRPEISLQAQTHCPQPVHTFWITEAWWRPSPRTHHRRSRTALRPAGSEFPCLDVGRCLCLMEEVGRRPHLCYSSPRSPFPTRGS
jgi:hypothetical protein